MDDFSQAPSYQVINDYGNYDDVLSSCPNWALIVIPLGRPVSYSRQYKKGIGNIVEGAYLRRTTPIIITDDCVNWSVSNSKESYIKSLTATLKPSSGLNYLSQDAVLPGDWLMGWGWTNPSDAKRVLDLIIKGRAANDVNDGLKFVGRVHAVRKHIAIIGEGKKAVTYTLQGIGFSELETSFYYDMGLANMSDSADRLGLLMTKLGLTFTDIANKEQLKAGELKDNSGYLIAQLVDLVLGSSAQKSRVNDAAKSEAGGILTAQASGKGIGADPRISSALVPSPQVNNEAPYSYLVPKTVGLLLGFPPEMASKASDVFGYADILQTVIGVQRYSTNNPDNACLPLDFFPIYDYSTLRGSRWTTDTVLKGTFLPVETSFVNRPLWQMLDQFCNKAINEKFTSLRLTPNGVLPTLVVRQIPFSTESIQNTDELPLTKFLNLPRWELDAKLINWLDVGRSNDTHVNLAHIYGVANTGGANFSLQQQMVLNAPIFDEVDIARSGIKGLMQTVNCHFTDQLQAPKGWMSAIADWSFGSQFTLNGTVQCYGIQSPIAEGDNLEIEDMVYHIEAITHSFSISPDGKKRFVTSMSLSNGMPSDQTGASLDFPRYPGFNNQSSTVSTTTTETTTTTDIQEDTFMGVKVGDETTSIETATTTTKQTKSSSTNTNGDNDIATSLDPGFTGESR